jgi:hypothetical protein
MFSLFSISRFYFLISRFLMFDLVTFEIFDRFRQFVVFPFSPDRKMALYATSLYRCHICPETYRLHINSHHEDRDRIGS